MVGLQGTVLVTINWRLLAAGSSTFVNGTADVIERLMAEWFLNPAPARTCSPKSPKFQLSICGLLCLAVCSTRSFAPFT
jgi:hypothetical protein